MKGRQSRDEVARQVSGHATAGREGGREGGLGVLEDRRLATGGWRMGNCLGPVSNDVGEI